MSATCTGTAGFFDLRFPRGWSSIAGRGRGFASAKEAAGSLEIALMVVIICGGIGALHLGSVLDGLVRSGGSCVFNDG